MPECDDVDEQGIAFHRQRWRLRRHERAARLLVRCLRWCSFPRIRAMLIARLPRHGSACAAYAGSLYGDGAARVFLLMLDFEGVDRPAQRPQC